MDTLTYGVEMIYSFPESKRNDQSSLLSDFVFPFSEPKRYSFIALDLDEFTKLFEIGMSGKNRKMFLCLNSSITTLERSENENLYEKEIIDQISNYNPNRFYYYFCIDVGDFVFKLSKNEGMLEYVELKRFICFKTFFPRRKFYEDILTQIFSRF